jgi:hypothetical protein
MATKFTGLRIAGKGFSRVYMLRWLARRLGLDQIRSMDHQPFESSLEEKVAWPGHITGLLDSITDRYELGKMLGWPFPDGLCGVIPLAQGITGKSVVRR